MDVLRSAVGTALLGSGLLLLVYAVYLDLTGAAPLRWMDKPLVLVPVALLLLIAGVLLVAG